MKIIRGIHNLPMSFSGCVLTMGNFDGVHLGHQTLLACLKQAKQHYNLPTVVMIFEPQPLEYFQPDNAPARLTSFQEKYYQLEQLGIDYLLCIPFNRQVATLSADDFVQQWLINQLQVQYIIVGDDFAFGRKREGDITLLAHYAKQGHFTLKSLPTYYYQAQRVSSTAIRQALSSSNFNLASQLLGRPYTICGKVIHGNALARQIGFPTANIQLHRLKPALHGVYLVEVTNTLTKRCYQGIANIGIRPTIDGKYATLEVNIFDFNQDIYGQYLTVYFKKKIRDEKKFTSLDDLKQQIIQDVCIARNISAKF
ncbi:MAG: bifunctional riboflavin kinase/FAD synthetase [Candidatus Schmidhempelia sp.]|nr:bifunctional riboflavin kinase/FAD synthetase [Candidatus Schmidhempelia sp.]